MQSSSVDRQLDGQTTLNEERPDVSYPIKSWKGAPETLFTYPDSQMVR